MEETKQQFKYPYLPEGKTIHYVSIENPFILRAREAARTSNDQSMPTGAVVVEEGKIIAEVSNKTPLSSPTLIQLHKKYCIRRILKIPSGQKYWACPGCASHANHAEYQAVVAVQKKFKGITRSDLDLYLWGHFWCCKPCWDKMMELPIKNVFLLKDSEKLFNIKDPNNIVGKQFN